MKACRTIKPQRCKSRECRSSKASKGEAVVYYRKPLATTEMRYARLSRRVKNMTTLILILDFTIGLFQNTEPVISEPLLLLL